MPALLAKPWYERPLTHRDLEDLPEDGNRYEVIDGVLYITPFPTIAHQRAAAALLVAVGSYLKDHSTGEAFISGTKVVLDEFSGVGPDMIYISRPNWIGIEDDGYYGAPDLVAEVTGAKPILERSVKFRKYALAGVPHYWMVDPARKQLEAYKFTRGSYRLVAEHQGADVFRPILFPGLAIDLSRLWGPASQVSAGASSPSARRAPRSAKPQPRRRR